MASTREERLQMRQRGAATRKIKEVDFGFSFGLAPPINETVQPASQPSLQPPAPSHTNSEPENTQSQSLTPQKGLKASQSQGIVYRSPGSSRNDLPERPSLFDIPQDDPPLSERSRKRRKIERPNEALRTSPNGLNGALRERSGSRPTHNRNADIPILQEIDVSTDIAKISTEHESKMPKGALNIVTPTEQDAQEQQHTQDTERESQTTQEAGVNGVRKDDLKAQEQGSQLEAGPEAPAARDTQEQEPTRQSDRQEEQELPKAPSEPSQPENITPPLPSEVKGQGQTQRTERNSPVVEELGVTNKEQETPIGHKEATRPKGHNIQPEERPEDKHGRPKLQADRHTPDGVVGVETAEGTAKELNQSPEAPQGQNGIEGEDPPREKRKRGRRPAAARTARDEGKYHGEHQKQTAEVGKGPLSPQRLPSRPSRGRKSRTRNVTTESRSNDVEINGVQPDQKADSTLHDREESTPRPSLSERQKRRKLSADSNKPIPTGEPEVREPEASAAPKRPRDRSSLSGKISNPEPVPQPEQPAQQTDEEAGRRDKGKKSRQPRGDTVPVTVHRLANVVALDSAADSADSAPSDEESADELSTRQKTKFANRGGVNPADVLSQVCRETLEKTLATLKDGIANESNTARRSEWTLKMKAVEAYGSELEGRLFELSEMLDSNFILNTQLRKSKREMADLRSRLHQVRKERERVALQMDAVRKKHADEKDARTSRTTINNTLHSLELVLDRTAADSSNSASTSSSHTATGLEFLLRSLAEDVSSIAPGSRGGLLNQIKAFNAQLEATARRLEE